MASEQSGGRRIGTLMLAAVTLLGTTACYTYSTPEGVAPAALVGKRVVLDLTDAGRVAMAERIGPSVARAFGRIETLEDSTVTLVMERTEKADRFGTTWSGERVQFARRDIGTMRLRTLSKGRTALAVGGVVGAVAAFLVTRELAGGGSCEPGGGPPIDPADQ